MPSILNMPKLSPTMSVGSIAKWHKKDGDFVKAGELLLEIATDKATLEYNALDEGYLRAHLVEEGKEVDVGDPIAIFSDSKDEDIRSAMPKPKTKTSKPKEEIIGDVVEGEERPQTAQTVRMATPKFVPEQPLSGWEAPRKREGERLFSSPLARKLAKERGLDITTVQGSGPRGRIVARDLNQAQPLRPVAFNRGETPQLAPGSYEEIALSPMRKVIAQRLQESKSYIPHFYVEQEIRVEALSSLREQLKEAGMKITVNDFILRAVALALRSHPVVNSGFNSETSSRIAFKTIDVAVAVSVEGGLITPIVRHADYKNLGTLSTEVRELAKRAQEGKLEPHEYKGGSFTVSNLGMYGIPNFTAILNPPQGAILAVGAIQDQPVVEKGQVVPGKVLRCTLSADHRIIDGTTAAEFMRTLKKLLETPALLLV